MATKFSPEEDETLIDLVREHPPLYIVKSKSYKNNTIKNNIWKKIGKKLHKKADECKLRWKSIRDYYQRKKKDYLKGKVTGSQRTNDGENSFPNKFQHLRFLDSTSLDERSTITNIQDSVQQEQEFEQLENDEVESQLNDRDHTTVTEHINSSKRYNDTEVTSIENPLKKKKTANFKDENMAILNEIKKGREERNTRDVFDKQKTTPQSTESIDPVINMFFKSVAATVSTFSPIDKAKIKAEVMSLVSKYEIDQITRQAIPTSYQNQWPINYLGHPSTSHGYNSPSTSNSADGNFHSHTATSEATSYVFSTEPEPEIEKLEMS